MAGDVEYKGHGQKPSFGARMSSVGRAIYNPQKKECFGRTASSWGKIGLFYLIFYSCLAGFFAAMMAGFFQTLSDKTPSMTGMYSLLKQNPGMGFRPLTHVESTLISFSTDESDTFEPQIDNIGQFLIDEGYVKKDEQDPEPESVPGLSYDISQSSGGGQCEYLPKWNADHYKSLGYSDGAPCVLLKLNRVIGWTPEVFNETDKGTEQYEEARKAMDTDPVDGYIGVSCEGENDGDIDNIGKVSFYPEKGFDASFYPYENEKDYRPPVVFAKFANAKRGVIMQVWCKAWAKNIKHHKNDKMGSVHFELFIEGKPKTN